MNDTAPSRVRTAAGALLLGFLLLTCGIEDYIMLEQIPESNITRTDASVGIRLPPMPTAGYFSNFVIYYRIYLSNSLQSGIISSAVLGTINPTLLSDYNALEPYTRSDDSTSVTAVISTLTGRNYYPLESLDSSGNNIIDRDIMYNASSTEELKIEFGLSYIGGEYPGFGAPLLSRAGNVRLMHRSTGSGTFTIMPSGDRRFLVTPELLGTVPSTTVNHDVVSSSAMPANYAYMALYILAEGINDDLVPIYSRPTFVGVFLLQ
ncbi:MAG: hypothetical protein LBQ35_09090 [Spirochaetaceae bacterium]|jgi:hypothetical protein|nr:hypothetical protein [Spirochaetaceae bacterium]